MAFSKISVGRNGGTVPGRRPVLTACAALATGCLAMGLPLAAQAQAEAWPAKPVTIVVPFPAGGGTDVFARPLSAALTKQFGKQFIVDNRGGAGGTLGAGVASRAAPDGYTWFLGGAHHAIAPSMYPKLDYNLEKDFIPVALVSSVPQVIVVNSQKLPAATDLKSLIAYLKANPGKVNFGSAGNGSAHHLAGELFKMQTQTDISHVPYRGTGPALADLVAGQIDMMFDGLGSSSGYIKSNRLKGIAVASEKRAPGFDALPTTAEGGLPEYKVSTWYGMWVPKNTPKEAVEKVTAALRQALASDEVKTAWANMGTEPPNLYGPDFGKFVTSEIQRWGVVVKDSGAKLE